MKYIRTENGIYEVEAITEEIMDLETGQTALVYHLSDGNYRTNYDEFNLADTIIELCDYVFLFDNEVTIRKLTHEDDEDTIEYLKECIELGMKIKLAILTDKGLIYVAEMNDEGDLKLI